MDRRSPPQKRTDDHAFPVRVKVLVPERGFENLLLDMHRWLDAAVGRGSFAVHGAGAGVNGGGKTSHGAAQESATSGIWNGCRERAARLARALPE